MWKKGKLFYLEYAIRLFLFLLFHKKGIYAANDLDTLLPNFWVARLKRSTVVYDSHEYFTEVPELVHRPRTRAIWVRLERWLFPKLKHAYTVNDSIANIYQSTYGVRVKVVRNLPFRKPFPPPSTSSNILIYQGALNVGRGIDLMIAAMAYLPEYQLWIVGRGDVEVELKEEAKAIGERVQFKGFVPFERLHELTCQATLGFSLEEDLGKNYHYASPNKVYDYIQVGVPVLVSDLPEMRAVVENHGVGEVLSNKERTPELLATKVREIVEDEPLYQSFKENCQIAAASLNWEEEKKRLLEIYQAI